MRFGQLRGVSLAGLVLATLVAREAAADGFHHTIPREVLARDLNTGGPYFAPPIPWGCYAKDGVFDHFYPKACLHGLFNHGCKGGGDGAGCGLFGKGCGKGGCGLGGKFCGGDRCGLGGGGCGLGGGGCGLGGDACGSGGKGCGLFGHKACGGDGCGSSRRIKDCGLCKNKGCGLCRSSVVGDPLYVAASAQGPAPVVMAPTATSQAGPAMLCDTCTGKGCGKCGFGGLLHRGAGDGCGTCGGKGCGLFGHKAGDGCGSCGKNGCGLFGHGNGLGHGGGLGHGNGDGCSNCGGKGCGLCNGLGNVKGKLLGLLHHKKGNIKYFVGPGGPVPLTPGYVPYTVTTRSPRDFLAFPPYTPGEY